VTEWLGGRGGTHVSFYSFTVDTSDRHMGNVEVSGTQQLLLYGV
jgi:hypothetical protein